jgi:hypothetical protein
VNVIWRVVQPTTIVGLPSATVQIRFAGTPRKTPSNVVELSISLESEFQPKLDIASTT